MTHDNTPSGASPATPGDDPRDWDAAYVLGSLSPADRLEYETYLRAHADARADVAELAGLPGLLNSLTAAEAVELLEEDGVPDARVETATTADSVAGSSATVQSLVARIDARRRRTSVGFVLVAAVSALVLVVGGFALGNLHAPGSRTSPSSSEALSAMTPAAGSELTADIGLVSKPWGARLDWHCQYATSWSSGDGSYDLVVTDDHGKRTTVATWQAIGGKAGDLSASTSIPASSIRSASITLTGSTVPLATRRF